jgi:hypothetical protein
MMRIIRIERFFLKKGPLWDVFKVSHKGPFLRHVKIQIKKSYTSYPTKILNLAARRLVLLLHILRLRLHYC